MQTGAISDLRQAAEHFARFYKGRASLAGHVNGHRGIMAYAFKVKKLNPETHLGFMQSHYVFFKRDWLMKGDSLFQIHTGGFWQTLNLRLLERAALENAMIIVVMPHGEIYSMLAVDWLRYANEHGTIRTPSTEWGPEASVPQTLLTELKPDDAVAGLLG